VKVIFAVDTETTGSDPDACAPVAMASVPVIRMGRGWSVRAGMGRHVLAHPGRPIPADAAAVHHITDAMVMDEAPPAEAARKLFGANVPDYFAAHNAPFDRAVMMPHLAPALRGVPWIDTWRAALHLVPDAPSFKLQVLRYHLGLKPRLPLDLAPHNALYDALVAAELVVWMLAKHPPQELIALSAAPVVLRKVSFGKHRDLAWADVPRDYLSWVVRQDFDADVLHTARHYLGANP
jgi:exodeoxyribonuclease X